MERHILTDEEKERFGYGQTDLPTLTQYKLTKEIVQEYLLKKESIYEQWSNEKYTPYILGIETVLTFVCYITIKNQSLLFLLLILLVGVGFGFFRARKIMRDKVIETMSIKRIDDYIKKLDVWTFEDSKKRWEDFHEKEKENPWIKERCLIFTEKEIENIVYAKVECRSNNYYLVCKNQEDKELIFPLVVKNSMTIFSQLQIGNSVSQRGSNVDIKKIQFEKHYRKGLEPKFYAIFDSSILFKES